MNIRAGVNRVDVQLCVQADRGTGSWHGSWRLAPRRLNAALAIFRMPMQLVKPSLSHLPSFVRAVERGWTMDLRGSAAAAEQLEKVREGPERFLASLEDRLGEGAPIKLPDGSTVPRLPGFQRWLWDGEFCGSIGLRWKSGTVELPEYCLGHIGYGVVPGKRGSGYATSALAQILPEARLVGLTHVDLTTDPDNFASQRVITANGGVFVKEFTKPIQFGGVPGLLFRIFLGE